MGKAGILWMMMVLSGCMSLADLRPTPTKEAVRLPQLAYKAADHLHAQLKGGEAAGYPMLAAAFVDASNLEATSDLGRLVSEQIASRLCQHGYSVVEVQLRSDQLALTPEGGVLALSRDLGKVNADVEGYSILLGTYTIIERQIFVNARVLRTSDGVALASSDFSLPYVRQRTVGTTPGGSAQPTVQTRLR